VAKNITKLKHRFPLRQVRSFSKWIRREWPAIVLILIALIISFLNYQPNTFLTGWDNLHPEFNPLLDLKRGLFSVWQEYRGLGLLGGMAHAADLPRTLIILLLSSFLPTNIIRYLLTFATLGVGSLGVYFFIDNILLKNKLDSRTTQTASLLGGLYYILNLSTLQTYFIPFETFTWFFAAFPWIFSAYILYLTKPQPKRLFFVFLLLLLSSPSFFVETTFIVLMLCLLPIFLEHIQNYKNKIKPILHSLTLISTTLLSQSFWLLPIIFFVFTKGANVEQARNNLLSSPETFERNLEFANFFDVATLRGYLFNYLDLGANNQYDYILSIWRRHLSSPSIAAIGIVLFLISAIGFFYLIKRKFKWGYSVLGLSLFCLFFLLGGGLLINQRIPLVGELFRSPFTKFSIPLSFCYSILFAVGTVFLLDIFTYLHSRLTFYVTLFTVTLFLFLYMSPVFSGNLVSPYLRRDIPSEYSELFEYFKTQPAGRIANLPQYNHWGWGFYSWGYRGSGFLWYGLPQALLDRAFDAWSKESETYYEEISSAIYSADWDYFDSLITKYSINWLLIDRHIIAPEGKIDLKTKDLEDYLSKNPKYTLSKNFNDTILVYETKIKDITQNFISTTSKSISVTPFSPPNLRPNTSLTLTSNSIVFPSVSLTNTQGFSLNLPSLSNSESLLPVLLSYQKAYGTLTLKIEPQTPNIQLNGQDIGRKSPPTLLDIPLSSESESLVLQIDQDFFELQLPAEITEFIGYYPIGGTYLPTKKPFTVNLYNGTPQSITDLTQELKSATAYQCFTDKPNRKIEKIVTGNIISILGTDVVGCLSTPLPGASNAGVYSVDFSYFSSTLTPGNVNVTNLNLGSENITQPLETTQKPRHTRIFSQVDNQPQKLNLILEANEAKTIQEVSYSNINLYFHPLLFSIRSSLTYVPGKIITLKDNINSLSVSTPIINSNYDTIQTPSSNQLLPNSRNCDQFNEGSVKKENNADGLYYESKNAIECDYLNLRHLPHGLNYLLSFDYRYQTGLPMTLCLENHSTRRCDVYERLAKTDKTQTLLHPIRNDSENQGFTLHLFNQSVGNKRTAGTLKNLSIHPLPLKFLSNITITSSVIARSEATKQSPTSPSLRGAAGDESNLPAGRQVSSTPSLSTTHPAEFLYTVNVIARNEVTKQSQTPSLLHLYQSKSPYWIALRADPSFQSLPLINQIIRLPFLYLSQPQLKKFDTGVDWYNTWELSEGEQTIVIFYAPQYLEFAGLAAIAFTLLGFVFFALSKSLLSIKKASPKKRSV